MKLQASPPPELQKSGSKQKSSWSSFFTSVRGLCWLLFITALTVYANTLNNGFALDDVAMIEKNTIVQKGVEGIPELLVTPRLAGFDPKIVNENYRPLSLVMFAMERQIFGTDPFTGHLINILLFAGCVVLLFLFLNRLFPGDPGAWFIASLLFALHPIHTEVVANIKSRDELMCFFLGIASLLLFIGYQRQGSTWKFIAGATLLFLAFLSKETVISFLFIVPVLFYVYLTDHRRRSHIVFAATIGVTALFLAIRQWVLKGHDASAVPFLDNPLAGAPLLAVRIPTALSVLGLYLQKMFVPWPLLSDYSYNTIPSVGFANARVWCSLIIYLAALITAVIRLVRKSKDPIAFGILFFLANLALFSNVFFLAYSEMAERLVFFASAGFCIVMALLLFRAFPARQGAQINRLMPIKVWWIVAPVCVIFAMLVVQRNSEWANNTVLFSADLKKAPGNARLWYSMAGNTVADAPHLPAGDTSNRPIIRAAITDMRNALTIYPEYYNAHLDIGNYFRSLGQFDSAEYHIKETLRIKPGFSIALSDLGFVYFSAHKYNEALALARTALEKDNKNTTIMFNIGMIFATMHQYDSARIWLQKTRTVTPDCKEAADYLANLQSQLQKAIDQRDTTHKQQ